MPYVTVPMSPSFRQMSFDDVLDDTLSASDFVIMNETNTRTYYQPELPESFLSKYNFSAMTSQIGNYAAKYAQLIEAPRESFYSTFYIGKQGKGMPHVFSEVFKSQHGYVECDTKRVCGGVAHRLGGFLKSHSPAQDAAMCHAACEDCAEFLRSEGFDITAEVVESAVRSNFRRIDAPNSTLSDALRELARMFDMLMPATYHTAAFAYVKGRAAIDAVKRHQRNESKWFLKTDMTNFFGSTTEDFLFDMFSRIFPFCEIVKSDEGKTSLKRALSLCFLGGGLPQGTPISPLLTNIMMIPIDHYLSNSLRSFGGDHPQRFVYTRYADDMQISCKYDFDASKILEHINWVLRQFNAPFIPKREKTHYGSSSGRNWQLGVMLNKDNNITIGYRKKQEFKAMCCNYISDKQRGVSRDLHEVQTMAGLISYYRSIEAGYVDYVIDHYNRKFGTDIMKLIKADLSA